MKTMQIYNFYYFYQSADILYYKKHYCRHLRPISCPIRDKDEWGLVRRALNCGNDWENENMNELLRENSTSDTLVSISRASHQRDLHR